MECPPEIEELLETVFRLNSGEIAVLMELCGSTMSVKDLASALGRDRSTVQRYLDGLRKAGLIDRQREGRKHLYSVSKDEIRDHARDRLHEWVEMKEQALDEL